MRGAFNIPDGIYLLSHSVGPLTMRAEHNLKSQYLDPFRTLGGDAWPSWLEALDGFCESLATVLGGSAKDYCPQTNLSSGLTKYLTALPKPGRRNQIVMHAHAFPSMGFVITALKSRGYGLKLIDHALDPANPNIWADHINPKTAALLITHVHSNTGRLNPISDIVNAVSDKSRNDIRVLVDIAQSVGAIPINIPSWGVDAVFGSCVKWVCGGPGAGFMWVNPNSIQDLSPQDVGWFSHEAPFEFDINAFRYAPDAKRFLGGTPSIASFIMAQGSLETISDIGVETIRRHNLNLMRRIRPEISACENGGTLCLYMGDSTEAMSHKLRSAGIYHDKRGPRLRLSFHIFNSEDEADHLAEMLCL